MKESRETALVTRTRREIERRSLVRAGERIGVAVSGGADSVALLFLLEELKGELGCVLSVIHFNHQLRGKDSDGDEKFAAKLAAKLGITFHGGRADIAERAKREKGNIEDTARRARYEFFTKLVDDGCVDKVAVAHTADDQAETVLAHILRGTGLAGLGGIHPRSGNVVRPLLEVRRAELRVYLRTKRQKWREDASNRDTTRMRARIRKKLLPLLEKQFQRATVEHLATLAELAREDEAFFAALASERFETCVERKAGSARIAIDKLLGGERVRPGTAESSAALVKRLVRHIVEEVKCRGGQLNAGHVRAVLELAAARDGGGKRLALPGGVEVLRGHDYLIFCARDPAEETKSAGSRSFEQAVRLDEREAMVRVAELSCIFRFRVIDWPLKRGDTIEKGFVLDCDALQPPLVLRSLRPGDKLRPYGHRSAHKLKRLLSEKHLVRWERNGWPVLTSGGVVAWTRGFPVAAEFAASEKTRAGLVVTEEPIR
ncbi:MAG TPA: tRNA lysidine(34) synthetase TilS [Candidatus Acidoferrum sp.]|nr:tRNA lysidine(34) synthetase TilS [Candidatus Acidoferrum sp.]